MKNSNHILWATMTSRLQYLVPQHALSRLAGYVSRCRAPWFKNWLIQWFIKRYRVDMTVAAEPNPLAYPDFNSFFTRALKPEKRPMAAEEKAIVCPVDGAVSQIGKITDNLLLQAKGIHYDVQQLLGGSKERAAPFLNGHFVTLYLAPKDYHRVHMPVSGRLREMIHVPGSLFSVNPVTTETVANLFARNERVITIFETEIGPMAVVLVGAMLVASISTVWAGKITPAGKQQVRQWQYNDQRIELARGQELGHFELGSTAIVLFGSNAVNWVAGVQPGHSLCFGQALT